MTTVPVTFDHARAARVAYQRFGRGDRGAKLNLGDCVAHARPPLMGEPPLFKGRDFSQTDVTLALPA